MEDLTKNKRYKQYQYEVSGYGIKYGNHEISYIEGMKVLTISTEVDPSEMDQGFAEFLTSRQHGFDDFEVLTILPKN